MRRLPVLVGGRNLFGDTRGVVVTVLALRRAQSRGRSGRSMHFVLRGHVGEGVRVMWRRELVRAGLPRDI